MRFVRSGRLSRYGARPTRAGGPIGAGGGGGGPSIPEGASAPVYVGYGIRTNSEVPILSVGARAGRLHVCYYTWWNNAGAWGGLTPTGFTGTFEADFNAEILWYGASDDDTMFQCVWKCDVPDPEPYTPTGEEITWSGTVPSVGIGMIRHTAHQWSSANAAGTQLWNPNGNGSDYWDRSLGTVGDGPLYTSATTDLISFPTGLTTLPANVGVGYLAYVNDNCVGPGGDFTFSGANTTTGTDYLQGLFWNADGDNAQSLGQTATLNPVGGSYYQIAPLLIVPGPAA